MALFGFGKRAKKTKDRPEAKRTKPRKALCRVCDARQQFSLCWRRLEYIVKCPCCGLDFGDPAVFYNRIQPSCLGCGEFLEQPGFEYGICDGCGSKHELVDGGKPCLLPNERQRKAMNLHGRARSQG